MGHIHECSPAELPNEILFFHLTRRLKDAEGDVVGHNLLTLLTTDNSFSRFFKQFDIKFYKNGSAIDVFNQGELIDWNKCRNGNSQYMQWRLQEDFCFNGFAFKDLLYRNTYARSLFRAPEFLAQLADCLQNPGIIDSYVEQSDCFCYEYKLPLERVRFDAHEDYSFSAKQQHLLRCVIERLDKYKNTNIRYMHDHDNLGLRLKDDDNLEADHFVSKERITLDMLRY